MMNGDSSGTPQDGGSAHHRSEEKLLRGAFDAWFSMFEKGDPSCPIDFCYQEALKLLLNPQIEPTAEEATSLLENYAGHPAFPLSGILLSACYARSPEKVIVYEGVGHRNVRDIGYELPENKTLLIPPEKERGGTMDLGGANVGSHARGNIIVCADNAGDIGYSSRGLLISTGKNVSRVAAYASGIALLRGKIGDAGEASSRHCLLISDAELDSLGSSIRVQSGEFEGTALLFARPLGTNAWREAHLIDAPEPADLLRLRGYFNNRTCLAHRSFPSSA